MEYIRARKFRRDEMCNTISKLDIRYYRWILEMNSWMQVDTIDINMHE